MHSNNMLKTQCFHSSILKRVLSSTQKTMAQIRMHIDMILHQALLHMAITFGMRLEAMIATSVRIHIHLPMNFVNQKVSHSA